MYDFEVKMKVKSLFEITGSKAVQKTDPRDGAYMSESEVKERCTSFNEVVQWIRKNRDVIIKQVVKIEDVTTTAQNQARDTGGYKD